MKVYRRAGSPMWYGDYVDGRGIRCRVSLKVTGKKAEAERALADLVAAVSVAVHNGKPEQTLSDCLHAYAEHLSDRQATWLSEARRLSAKALTVLDGSLPIHMLTTSMMEGLVAIRRKEGLAPGSIKLEVSCVRAAVLYAVQKRGKAGPQDMSWCAPAVTAKTRYLTLDDFKLLHDHLKDQDLKDLLVMLAMTGGRWSEVRSLRWDRIDLAAGTIRIWGNKTQRERLVGIPSIVRGVLERRSAVHAQEAGEAQPRATDLVFPNREGDLRGRCCWGILAAINACGLNDPSRVREQGRATVHSLRHTFASLLLQNGASLADIQDALGHTNIQMTRRYAHLVRAESATKLANILSEKVQL